MGFTIRSKRERRRFWLSEDRSNGCIIYRRALGSEVLAIKEDLDRKAGGEDWPEDVSREWVSRVLKSGLLGSEGLTVEGENGPEPYVLGSESGDLADDLLNQDADLATAMLSLIMYGRTTKKPPADPVTPPSSAEDDPDLDGPDETPPELVAAPEGDDLGN